MDQPLERVLRWIVVAGALVWGRYVRDAMLTHRPSLDPTRFAVVMLGQTSDATPTATFDGTRLRVSHPWSETSLAFGWSMPSPSRLTDATQLVGSIFARFPHVSTIEVMGNGGFMRTRLRRRVGAPFDAPFMALTFTRTYGADVVTFDFDVLVQR